MTLQEAIVQLEKYEQAAQAYGHAMGILSMDAITAAPKRSSIGRARAMGYLSGELYRCTMDPQLKEAVETIRQHHSETSPEIARRAERLKEDLDETALTTEEEYTAYSTLMVEADTVWHEAKLKSDFPAIAPYLEKIVGFKKMLAQRKDSSLPVYDVLLDTYEKGVSTRTLDPFFATLRERLTPVVLAVGEKPAPEDAFLHVHYPKHEQDIFSHCIMRMMGIDEERCSLAETEHPFTDGIDKWNVRITTHYLEDDVSSSMYSVLHEGGHALYELGVKDEYQFTSLAGGSSMSLHESQSRFYENLIGRSLPFCRYILPVMQEIWPEQLKGITPEKLYAAVNLARPSLIRTQADELTYPMHIMIRYELEKQIMAGAIQINDLPALWNKMYKKYLGISVPNDREGVLQDMHWSGGLWGYFPSYALGSAYGVQMLHRMEKTLDVWSSVEHGDLHPVNTWLGEHLHQYGNMLEPAQLLQNALGEPFDPIQYTDYLTRKYTELYHL